MKRAIVIGSSSGIGKEIAKLLAADNYKVGITGRRQNLLNDIEKENEQAFVAHVHDVADLSVQEKTLETLTMRLGGLDMLVICAGTGDINENLNFDIEQRTIQTNVLGFTQIADWAFRFFQRQGFGHLIGITSIGGLRGNRQAPSYYATKAYQINYLESLRQKAAKLRKPIFVTDVRPGLVDTEMAKGEGLFWVMPADKTARQTYQAIKKKKKIVYVTRRWRLIAAILRKMPSLLYDRL